MFVEASLVHTVAPPLICVPFSDIMEIITLRKYEAVCTAAVYRSPHDVTNSK